MPYIEPNGENGMTDTETSRVTTDIDYEKTGKQHAYLRVPKGKRVARFYQIDSKIDSIIDFDIARSVPLVR